MSVALTDPKTIEAIGILANVLDDMAGPERLECLMAANALRQVQETRSENALSFARQAFESLDPAVRRQIKSEATDAAVKLIESGRRLGAPPVEAPTPPKPRLTRPAPKPSGSSVLDAINGGGMRTERKW